MVRISIDVPLLFNGLDTRVHSELSLALDKIDNILISNGKSEIFRKNKIASKTLAKSIASKGREITGNKASTSVGVIGNRALAARAIELGRGKGKPAPPLEPILEWMEFKGIGSDLPENKRRSLAYVIAKSIGDKGIKPAYIFRDAVDEKDVAAIQRIVEESLRKAIRSLANE
jgi:hypothetical protein